MENPIDHTIDLGLVNYVRHPKNPDYIIYRFVDEMRANHFQAALENEKIWFEKDIDKIKTRDVYLFAVHKNDYKKVVRLNYLTEAAHRKNLIPIKSLRYALVLFSFSIIFLAILGFCNRKIVHNNQSTNHIIEKQQ